MNKVYIIVNQSERYVNEFTGLSTTLEGARNIIKAWYITNKKTYSQWDEEYTEIDMFSDVPHYYISTEPFQDGWLIFVYDTDKPSAYLSEGWKSLQRVPSI